MLESELSAASHIFDIGASEKIVPETTPLELERTLRVFEERI